VNTFGSQVLSINNYAPAGADGYNIWIGNGGQISSYTSSSDGSYNIGIGLSSLRENTTGQLNTAIGVSTLTNNSTGTLNTAVGTGALTNNTIGERNTAIGVSVLGSNTTGDDNTGVGLNTVASNTSGDGNTGVGGSALVFNTSGSYNTSVGYLAGTYASPVPLSNQTSSYSTYVGYDTRASVSGAVGETVIGSQAIGNGTNTVTIGGSSNTYNVFQYGKTLVGYSATQDNGNYPLQVNGQIYATNATIATSDARLKENIEPLPSGLKEVMSLKPCAFDFRKDTGLNLSTDRQVGFIAQDVAATVKGTGYEKALVQEAGGNLALAETKLIPLLVKAIQEQQAQIEALKKEIEQLKNK
jgi:hypothetical protein